MCEGELEMKNNIYQLKIKKEKRMILIAQIIFSCLFFALWEIFSYIGWLDKFLFSCPSEIILLLIENIKSVIRYETE